MNGLLIWRMHVVFQGRTAVKKQMHFLNGSRKPMSRWACQIMWIMCAFIKASLLIFLQTDILGKAFPEIRKTSFLVIISVVLIVCNLFIAGEIERFSIIDNSVIKIVITGFAVLVIPVIMLIFARKGENKKCAED